MGHPVPELNNASVVKLIEDSIHLMTKFEPENIEKMGTFKIICEGCKENVLCLVF